MQNETTNQTPAREAPDSSVRPVKVKMPRKLRSLAEASLTINLPMVKEPVGELAPIRTPEATAALLADMRHLAQEAFVVLTLTGLVLITSGLIPEGLTGTALTQAAFSQAFGGFGPVFIAICMFFFAFSTIIGWYFFGQSNFKAAV